MMAAITAARQGAGVMLLDQNPKPGKKLLLTGNGRCNLTNTDPKLWEKYHSSQPEALAACVATLRHSMDTDATIAFFEHMGLLTIVKDGYVYPLSNTSESVLHVLERAMERVGIKRKYANRITSLSFDHASALWEIRTDTYTYQADKVILACGSKACPETGSDGSGYALAAKVGHGIIRPVPALTGLRCDLKGFEKAAGCRCRARVTVCDPETKETVSDVGQVQWNRDGIAGVVVFQVSGFVSERLADRKKVMPELDLLPDLTVEQATAFIREQWEQSGPPDPARPGQHLSGLERSGMLTELLRGMLPAKLAVCVGKVFEKRYAAGTNVSKRSTCKPTARAVSSPDAADVAAFLKSVKIPVTGVRGFAQAQVCRGGVSLSEIDPETFESKIAPGLFFAGEILDADGPCGGYNLQWAFSSGYVAGMSASQR